MPKETCDRAEMQVKDPGRSLRITHHFAKALGTASCMNKEIHSFALVRSCARPPRSSTDPSGSDTNLACPNVVINCSAFGPVNGLIRFFMC